LLLFGVHRPHLQWRPSKPAGPISMIRLEEGAVRLPSQEPEAAFLRLLPAGALDIDALPGLWPPQVVRKPGWIGSCGVA